MSSLSTESSTTAAAVEEKRKLRKHFGRFDIFFYLLCTLVGIDTIGAAAAKGAQGFTWLAFLGLFFFIPYALLTAELGSTFTEEGGPYYWARLAFGRCVGALVAVMYWISNPVWVGGTLCVTAVAAVETFFCKLDTPAKYLLSLAFIWLSVLAAVLSFRVGKWVPTLGAWARCAVLLFFSVSVVLYAVKNGVHGFAAGEFAPTYANFITLVPILIFNYVGFELPNAAGDEMRDPERDVPYTVARSAVGTILLYGVPILAVLLVLPRSQVTSLGGFLAAIKAVFTVYGGHVDAGGHATLTGAGQVLGQIGAAAVLLALLSSGTTWLMGADRALAVAAYDGAGPRLLGQFSERWGTPVLANLLSGVVSTLVMVLAFNLTAGDANKYFSAALGLAISTNMLAYLAVFPALIRLRYLYPDAKRFYRVPGGVPGVWLCGSLLTGWALLATVALVWPGFGVGWFGTGGDPNDALPAGFSHHRAEYEWTQLLPLTLMLALGFAFYRLGGRTRHQLAAAAAAPSVPVPEMREGDQPPLARNP